MNSPFPHWRFTRAGLLLLLVLCIIQVASGNDSWDESRRNGTIAREQGRYPEAKRFLEAAVARLSDPKDPRRADLDDELASVYELLGEWGAAEHAYRDALTIIENDRDNQLGIRTAIGATSERSSPHKEGSKKPGNCWKLHLQPAGRRLAKVTLVQPH